MNKEGAGHPGNALAAESNKQPSVKSEDSEDRSFGGKIEFFLTCVGYAVGLGNVWRFPYLTYQNGGGAFLIPYTLSLLLIGLPIFFMDLSLGQFASLGHISIWRVAPFFKGLGFAMNIAIFFMICYYNVVVAWAMFYLFASMTSELPWAKCGNCWNTPFCIDDTMNRSAIEHGMINDTKVSTSAEEYYNNYVLQRSEGLEDMGHVVWQLALLLALAWVIVFIVLINGMKSVGKAAYFVSLFPYVLLTILLGQGASLPGAIDGIKFYMIPDWERLKDGSVWGQAAVQIFYSLGICFGGLITVASYNPFKHNALRDAILIPIINCLTSIYAGFVVFSVLGYIAHTQGVDIDEVAQGGPGLVFVVYPEGLSTMPAAPLWSILFFFMMTTLGFSTSFSMAEGVCMSLIDEYPDILKRGRRPTLVRIAYCLISFLLGLPMVTQGGFYIFLLMDTFAASYALFFIGALELIAINYVYGYKEISMDIEMMIGKKPNIFFKVTWMVISPLLSVAVGVFSMVQQPPMSFDGYEFPAWGNAMGWLMTATPLVVILSWMIGHVCYYNKKGISFKEMNEEDERWGPSKDVNRLPPRYGPLYKRSSGVSSPKWENSMPDTYTSTPQEYGGNLNPAYEKESRF